MKKLLLIIVALLSLSTTYAQLEFNKTYANWGYTGATALPNGDKQLMCNFNSDSLTTLKYGSFAGTSKGVFAMVLTNEVINSGKALTIKDKKQESWGAAGGGLRRMRNVQDVLDSATVAGQLAYSTLHQYWRPSLCLFNLTSTDQVFGVYPGMYKRVNLGFQVKVEAAMSSDISFDVMTYNQGNTGKAAIYKMIVGIGKETIFPYQFNTAQLDTIAKKNVAAYRTLIGSTSIYVVDSVYTTTTTVGDIKKVTINVASALGLNPSVFSGNGKKTYIQLYTMGTATSIMPGTIDPVVAIDNIQFTYTPAGWALPVGAVASSIFDHNNGTVLVDTAKTSPNYSAGTPVNVAPADTNAVVKFYITSINRPGTLTITEANDGGSHAAAYSFAKTGAVKAKAADGTYSVVVPYTYAASNGTTKFLLTIAAPASGTANDTLEVSIRANVPLDANRLERLEITNGTRFWYDIAAKGVTPITSTAPSNVSPVKIMSINSNVFVKNATENVSITNVAGQTIKIASPTLAAKGISMNAGVYIVKTGNTTRKVIVQ